MYLVAFKASSANGHHSQYLDIVVSSSGFVSLLPHQAWLITLDKQVGLSRTKVVQHAANNTANGGWRFEENAIVKRTPVHPQLRNGSPHHLGARK